MTLAFTFLASLMAVFFITRNLGFATRNAIFMVTWFYWLNPYPDNPFENILWALAMFFLTELLYRIAKYHFK